MKNKKFKSKGDASLAGERREEECSSKEAPDGTLGCKKASGRWVPCTAGGVTDSNPRFEKKWGSKAASGGPGYLRKEKKPSPQLNVTTKAIVRSAAPHMRCQRTQSKRKHAQWGTQEK